MNFEWMKKLLPRGLYGRAALILFLPVGVVTIVVTVMFMQRHFEDVTRQMTTNLSREIGLIAARINAASDPAEMLPFAEELADPLQISIRIGQEDAGPDGMLDGQADGRADRRAFYDFSGRAVIATMHEQVPDVQAVDLSNPREVRLIMDGRHGTYELGFSRRLVSAANPHQLLVLLIGTALVMTVIAAIFLRNQMRPIRRLARVAEAYGKGRVLPYRPAGALEVRNAGAAFLDMRNRLERQNEQRGLMLTAISHDLRTPLTRLRLGLSMLSPDMPPEQDEIGGLIGDVNAMSTMVEAFLAHAQSVAHDAPPGRVCALEFLRGIVADAQRGGQEVTLHGFEGDPQGEVTLRADALRRAVENLLGNAVRYGTRVEVDAALTRSYFRISVEDDGPGIPVDRREAATRPFTRLDAARSQNKGEGVGLGLSIASDIARAHGGQLRLGDGARLGGLRAEIVLPC